MDSGHHRHVYSRRALMRILNDNLDIRENPHAFLLVLPFFPALAEAESDLGDAHGRNPRNLAHGVLAVMLTFRPRHPA
jgi:hypothetical protein